MIKNEIRPLTGIRGIAALWVVCLHFEKDFTQALPSLAVFHPFFMRGSLGVDLFFILSGFVISTVYKIDTFNFTLLNYRNFLVNRLARIYPDYLFCLCLLVIMVAADQLLGKNLTIIGKHLTNPADYPVSSIGWHVLMMQTWPLIPAKWANWNTPAWSVSAEWFAYLFLFPLSIWLASISIIRKYRPIFVFLLLASFITFGQLAEMHGYDHINFIWRITAEFMTGCLLYLFYLENARIVKILAARLDMIILAFAVIVWFSTVSAVSNWLIILSIPLIIVGLTQEASIFAKMLSSSLFCYLGRISYALYLVHAIAQRMLHIMLPVDRYTTGPLFERLGMLLVYLIFPLLVAMGIYHLIEEPSRLIIRSWCNPKSRR